MDGWLTWCQFWRKSTSRSLSTFCYGPWDGWKSSAAEFLRDHPRVEVRALTHADVEQKADMEILEVSGYHDAEGRFIAIEPPIRVPTADIPKQEDGSFDVASTTGSGLSHRLLSWWCTTYPMTFTRQWRLCGPKQPATSGTCGLPLRRATLSWSSGPGGNSATKRPWGWRWPGPPPPVQVGDALPVGFDPRPQLGGAWHHSRPVGGSDGFKDTMMAGASRLSGTRLGALASALRWLRFALPGLLTRGSHHHSSLLSSSGRSQQEARLQPLACTLA